MKFDTRATPVCDEEAYVGGTRAHNDGVAVVEMAAVDVDGKVARRQTRERALHAALKFIVRRTHTDCLAHGEG